MAAARKQVKIVLVVIGNLLLVANSERRPRCSRVPATLSSVALGGD
jgi:hypothetical protein